MRSSLAGIASLALAATACGSTAHHGAAPVATTVARPTTTTTTTASTASSWSRDGAPQLSVGGGATTTLSAVLAPVAAGGSWLVAGTTLSADGTGRATVWTSPDAHAWTPVALTGPGITSEATAVTAFNGGTVVVGSVGTGSSRRAAVWASTAPGAAFAQLPDQAAFSGEPGGAGGVDGAEPSSGNGAATTGSGARMTAVAAGALGVFATGSVGGQQAVWYSTDGRHFTRDSDAERVIDRAPRPDVTALVVSPNGVFAAGTMGAGTATDAAVWTSTDGLRWSLEADSGQVFTGQGDHEITGMVSVDRYPGLTFVAVGAVDTGHGWTPASWLSPDGTNWSAPSLSFPEAGTPPAGAAIPGISAPDVASPVGTAPGGTTADAVTADPGGYVAVGGGEGEALAWTSPDGRNWTPLALPPGAATAPWHAGLVGADAATTLIGDPDTGQAHLLAYDPAVAGATGSAATGSAAVGAAAVGSAAVGSAGAVAPGGAWSEPTSDAAIWGSPQAQAVPVSLQLSGGSLRLLVDVAVPGQSLGPVTRSVVELTSTDGESWQAVGGPGTSAFDGSSVAAVGPSLPVTGPGSGGAAATGSAPTTAAAPGPLPQTSSTAVPLPEHASGASASPSTTGSPTDASPTSATATTAASGVPSAAAGAAVVAVGSRPGPPVVGSGSTSAAAGPPITNPSGVPEAAAWDSPDGVTWSAMPVAAGAFGTGMTAESADAVATLGSGRLVAVGTGPSTGLPAGGAPLAWVDDPGGAWQPGVPLDGPTELTAAVPVAACPSPAGIVAVGQGPTGTGRAAVAWTSANGATWRQSVVTPQSVGAVSGMAGCTTAAGHLLAWGLATPSAGGTEPALWDSKDGRTWDIRHVGAFDDAANATGDGTAAGLGALAISGKDWLAAGGDTVAPSTAPAAGLGLWRSSDGGTTWNQVDTGAQPWASAGTVSIDQVAWLGRTAIAAGTVDGRLTVWVAGPTT